MNRARIIFGSNSELAAYEAIARQLPHGWKLYGNTPLPQLVVAKCAELTGKEWDYYLKASVDFVLTTPTHEPVLAIEFDGLGAGFSSGRVYIQRRDVDKDPYRELKVNFMRGKGQSAHMSKLGLS
jgi:hypothetical protein